MGSILYKVVYHRSNRAVANLNICDPMEQGLEHPSAHHVSMRQLGIDEEMYLEVIILNPHTRCPVSSIQENILQVVKTFCTYFDFQQANLAGFCQFRPIGYSEQTSPISDWIHHKVILSPLCLMSPKFLDMIATSAMVVLAMVGLAWLIYQKLGLGETSSSVRLVGPAKMWRRREDCSRLERVSS